MDIIVGIEYLLLGNYSNRLARALSTIRVGTARAVVEMFMRKLQRIRHIWKSEILVPYLNNPSEETIFGNNDNFISLLGAT